MSRLKRAVRFYGDELPVIEQALLDYQSNTADNEKLFFKISKMIKHLYTDDLLTEQRHIKALENKGYEVKKKA